MNKQEFELMLKEFLSTCNLKLDVDDDGYVKVVLEKDGNALTESYCSDLLGDIQDAKDSKEARCWC